MSIFDGLKDLNETEYESLIKELSDDDNLLNELLIISDKQRKLVFNNKIFIRGLIEFSNYCKKDCYYCGLRCSNKSAERYRLSESEILDCCDIGYEAGFRTFVLQGGEDAGFSDSRMTSLIYSIKERYPQCALTLSVGERDRSVYKEWKDAGADRYLLRHETADEIHYEFLHPLSSGFKSRQKCLYYLKELGYQTGAGMMIGSPGQTYNSLAKDVVFLKNLDPQMVGIGPFLPQKNTPFYDKPKGTLKSTLIMIAIVRLVLPYALIPSTTALASLCKEGRVEGIKAGANVIMPNLSPEFARKRYNIYDGKISSGNEAAENLLLLKKEMEKYNYEIVTDRGDFCRRIKCIKLIR